MKKSIAVIIMINIMIISLCGCNPVYDPSKTDSDSTVSRQTSDPKDIFYNTFVSKYYSGLGSGALADINGGQIDSLIGRYGMTFIANTPERMLISYQLESMPAPYIIGYNKFSGDFTYACPDALCGHTDCLFNGEYRIFAGSKHLFYRRECETEGKKEYYYCSDLFGNDPYETDIPTDNALLSESEKGIYYLKYTFKDEKYYTSLWLYDSYRKEHNQLTGEKINVSYYVIDDAVYIEDSEKLTFSRMSDDYKTQRVILEDNIPSYQFGKSFYVYDAGKEIIFKVSENEPEEIYDVSGIEFDALHISGGYLYYTCRDTEFIEKHSGDEELYKYLSQYNTNCGRVYRIKNGTAERELIYSGACGGIPYQISNVYSENEVVYIEYRDHTSFINNYSGTRKNPGFVILDAASGEYVDIPNV